MRNTSTLVVATAIAGFSCVAYGQPYGQLTVTENLIRREIVRLGGDWESGRKPLLVSFLGDKFESRHFEMLTHLPTVEFFHAEDCLLDQFALACLSRMHRLERLDITRCSLKSESLSLLRGNRELKEIYLESITVTKQVIAELATLEQIKTLMFDDCEGLTEERLSTLRAALPNVSITATVRRQ